MKKIFENIFNVRSIITIILTVIMGFLLLSNSIFNQELLMLFCATYGITITYFFTSNGKNK